MKQKLIKKLNKMKNLISMTDFVLEQGTEINTGEMFYRRTYSYAKLLKQSLELWMFLPCDKYGNVLDKPFVSQYFDEHLKTKELLYIQAKERRLFDGFEWKIDESFAEEVKGLFDKKTNRFICAIDIGMTIEDLVCINPELTETSIKQIFS